MMSNRGKAHLAIVIVLCAVASACAPSLGADAARGGPPVGITPGRPPNWVSAAGGARAASPTSAGTVNAADGAAVTQVRATAQTDPVPSDGDAADDAAIWVHPDDPEQSTVIGTDKQGGIAVYDLDGTQLQYLADGALNNVDLRAGFPLAGAAVTLVAASDRTRWGVGLYTIDVATRLLVGVAGATIPTPFEPYGLCLYRSPDSGVTYAFVTARGSGELGQWELREGAGGGIEGELVRSLDVGSTSEGCVADDQHGWLYVGEETTGIWRYAAEPDGTSDRTLIDSTGPDGHLDADVEGLAIADDGQGGGYLLASSQGDDTFAIYRRDGDNAYLGSFAIEAGTKIDGVEDADGIDVTTTPLGERFPGGLFVAQDGERDADNQNFKLVPLEAILPASGL